MTYTPGPYIAHGVHDLAERRAQAAALELLAALKAILPYAECDVEERIDLRDGNDDEIAEAESALEQARAAIAKAESGQ